MPSTAPYRAADWKRICACGQSVEALLDRSGVQLTMGGEPTFVPTHPSGAEWQTAAFGPTKLAYARKLAQELIRRAYSGGVVLETSGKQFPGEPLPRWALLIQRREDGQPIWREPARLRADAGSGHHRPPVARKMILALGRKLAVDPALALPLVETHAPTAVTGYVLPLDRDAGGIWITDDWKAALGPGPLVLF